MDWKDVTTYRQGEKDRKPRSIECELNDKIKLKLLSV